MGKGTKYVAKAPDENGLIRYTEDEHRMRLLSVHPGYTVDDVIANALEFKGGYATGKLKKPFVAGATKADIMRAYAREHGVEVRAIDADLPLFNIRTFDESLAQQRWPQLVAALDGVAGPDGGHRRTRLRGRRHGAADDVGDAPAGGLVIGPGQTGGHPGGHNGPLCGWQASRQAIGACGCGISHGRTSAQAAAGRQDYCRRITPGALIDASEGRA